MLLTRSPALLIAMKLRANSNVRIMLILGLLLAAPAHGQIVSVLDEHGHRVYINAEPIPTRSSSLKGRLAGANPGTTVPSARTSEVRDALGTQSAISSGQLSQERLEQLVQMTADRHHVDPALVRAVVHTESGGNPAAVSSKGAIGLMQLMPETAHAMGVTNAFSPQDNLDGGVRYLRTLLERYNGDLDKSLAAYNAGTGAVDRAGGVPHYRQTQDYVRKVTNSYYGDNTGITGGKGKTFTAQSKVAVAPQPSIYQTHDAQGRVVWTNN